MDYFEDVDECLLPNVCDPVANCTNFPGSYKCSCPAGFKGDGKFCQKYQSIDSTVVGNMTGWN